MKPKRRRRHPRDLTLHKREREVLNCVAALLHEVPQAAAVEQRAVEALVGPAAGSLASLVTLGHLEPARPAVAGREDCFALTQKGGEEAKKAERAIR